MTGTFSVVRHPLKIRHLVVLEVETPSPRVRRIHLGGAELAGFVTEAPEDHVKVFFPSSDGSLPVPVLRMGRLTRPLKGPRPVARDYTPLAFDGEHLSIDFFLHDGGGVAAEWARHASPGDEVAVAGPRGSKVLEGSFSRHVFIGDETAHPEFARRIAELDPHAEAFLVGLIEDETEERSLPHRCRLHARWVHRRDSRQDAHEVALVRALREHGLPPDHQHAFYWVAGEAGEVKAVGAHLVYTLGVSMERLAISGHWKRGEPDHDHHEVLRIER